MEKNNTFNVFLEFIAACILVVFLSAIPSLLSGWYIEFAFFILVAFLFCSLGVVLSLFFPKVRSVIWLGVAIGAVLVNWLLSFFFVWATRD